MSAFNVSKIIIADDHPLFRDAQRNAISQQLGDVEVVETDSFSSLQRCIRDHGDSDLILLDLMMPGAVGFSALNFLGLECPEIPVVVISGNEEPPIMARALNFGAMAFVPKSSPLETIVDAMQTVFSGEVWTPEGFDPDSVPLEDEQDDFAARIGSLTPKQFRVLMMLADGQQNKQIASDLFISEATVKAHLTTVFQKLGVQNRTQAAAMATRYLKIERLEFS